MRAGDERDDREAEPRASARAGLVGAAETVERANQEGFRETRPVVQHVQLHRAFTTLDPEVDGAGSVSKCVVHEVSERLLDPFGVGL